MVSFENDYNTGCHPELLRRLVETNLEPLTGYENDPYCLRAADKIRAACECPDAQVFILVGGTQTNQTVISTVLQPYEGVIAGVTGHVSVHEAGAIEYSGHKVLQIPAKDGKISAENVRKFTEGFYGDANHEHMVFPGMVYISYPTELGTLYSKEELRSLYAVCREYGMVLYIDGARLGYGLASRQCDLTLPELAKLCDVFYIGGTKVGALCGEAVVFTHGNAPRHFITQVKQRGAMLAKGRLLGIQFDALFTDDLYMRIGRHAIEKAEKLKSILHEKNCRIWFESPTNQQYIIIENSKMQELAEHIAFSFWELYDADHTVIRFVTNWATTDEDLETLRKYL